MKLRWLLTFSLITFGLVLSGQTGLFARINDADVTKLSFVILLIFLLVSLQAGHSILTGRDLAPVLDRMGFTAKLLIDLGLIGTVLGFIYMLSVTLQGVENMQPERFRQALQDMGQGMGTALWTTAAGLVCSVVLKLQIRVLSRGDT